MKQSTIVRRAARAYEKIGKIGACFYLARELQDATDKFAGYDHPLPTEFVALFSPELVGLGMYLWPTDTEEGQNERKLALWLFYHILKSEGR